MKQEYQNYLDHHGIKGQQWGVMRGPPYPIRKGNGVRIRKGTKFQRLSTRDESDAKGHAYVTYDKEDNERYKGFFGQQLKTKALFQKNAKVYVHQIEAAEDLRSPSQQERIDIFLDLYAKNSEIGKELGSYHKKEEWHGHAYGPEFYYRYKYSRLKGRDKVEKGYKTFVKAIGGNENIRNQYFAELRKRGYNMIRDDQDSGVQGVTPSIILDREKNTKYVGKRELGIKEIAKNYKKYGKYLDKKRRHREWES